MKSTKLIPVLLLLLLIPGSALFAQDDRLNQDIRVGEKILLELITDNDDDFPLRTGQSSMVQGEYIAGYGVHFVVGTDVSSRGIMARLYSRMEKEDEAESGEDVIQRVEKNMRDYLQNYAVVSRHLADDENVLISYNSQNNVASVTLRPTSRADEMMTIPNISVRATAADLKRHRNGSISDDQLQQRITVHAISADEVGNDLKVFSSVLRTSLENTETDHIRVGRDIRFNYVPELGAHYHINITTEGVLRIADFQGFSRQNNNLNPEDVANIDVKFGEFKMDSTSQMRFNAPQIEFKMDSARVYFRGLNDSLKVDLDGIRKQAEEARREGELVLGQFEAVRREADDIRRRIEFRFAISDTIDYSADAEKIMGRINEVIADYGQTLRSLSDGEQLMITVNWRRQNLPERTTLQITKEDLFFGRTPTVTEY